jgi:hypothetical protein
MNKKLFKIFLLALLLRLVLAPLTKHSDVIDSLNWGKNLESFGFLEFYSRTIPDAGPQNYPPGFYYILTANQWVYRLVKNVLWKINLGIPLFPSGFYLWFESDLGRIFFNKLPAIFADLAIGFLIYRFVGFLKNKKTALFATALFLFSPPIWYISALWGQNESLFALPLLASFYAVYRKKIPLAAVLYTASFLIKPTVILVSPIFLLYWIKEKKFKDLLKGVLLTALFFYIVHLPFSSDNTLSWIYELYRCRVREILGYLVANAFNFWSFIFGFEPRSDRIPFLGLSAHIWGIGTYVVVMFYLLINLIKNKQIKRFLLAATIISFVGFFFLPRIHERYFYFVLIFLAPLVGMERKFRKIFFLTSTVFFLNLYHYWWVPRIDLVIKILSTRTIEQGLTIINFMALIWLINDFRKNNKNKTVL